MRKVKDKYPKNLEYYLASYLLEKGVGSKKVVEAVESGAYKRMLKKEIYSTEAERLKIKFQELGVSIVPYWSEKYPQDLRTTSNFPALLFCKGNLDLLKKRMITIVGTRNITVYGKMIVRKLIGSIQTDEVCYVSGLAFGIDSEVHSIALERKIPTIAVVAGGIDQGYPRSNDFLYRRISAHGLILSEFPPGRPVVKGMFPMRNRILAGISESTVVVEAASKSGSLITAEFATEFGRDVYAFPARVGDRNALGVNRLISEGAGVIYDRESWLQALKINALIPFPKELPDNLKTLLSNNFPESGWLVSELTKITGIEEGKLVTLLTRCELEGILSRNSFGRYNRSI